MATPGHEQVGRLDIAVDDPLPVRRVEGVGDLGAEIEDRRFRHRARREERLERLPLEQFHGEEALSFVLAEIVDRADVWMVQRRGSARLPFEPLDRARIVGQLRGQELQRDVPAQSQILGAIDDAHADRAGVYRPSAPPRDLSAAPRSTRKCAPT